MMTEVLSQKEKELIAVGAAVSAGCAMCSNHHFKQAFKRGATKDEVHHAVIAATAVMEDSMGDLQRTTHRLMDMEPQESHISDVETTEKLTALIKLAAAVAVNNVIYSKRYIGIADKLGASSRELHSTIKLVRVIQKRAGKFVDEAIEEAFEVIGVKNNSHEVSNV